MKWLILLILLLSLSSCTQYTAIPYIEPNYNLILENDIVELYLYENNRQVFIENIGNQLVIKLDYNINENNIIIYDVIVLNEKLFLYAWSEYLNYNVTITINGITTY